MDDLDAVAAFYCDTFVRYLDNFGARVDGLIQMSEPVSSQLLARGISHLQIHEALRRTGLHYSVDLTDPRHARKTFLELGRFIYVNTVWN